MSDREQSGDWFRPGGREESGSGWVAESRAHMVSHTHTRAHTHTHMLTECCSDWVTKSRADSCSDKVAERRVVQIWWQRAERRLV